MKYNLSLAVWPGKTKENEGNETLSANTAEGRGGSQPPKNKFCKFSKPKKQEREGWTPMPIGPDGLVGLMWFLQSVKKQRNSDTWSIWLNLVKFGKNAYQICRLT